MFKFPEDKARIAKLSYEHKLEWYQHQFEKSPGEYPVELTTPEFQRFWKWQVVIPMKIARFFFRVKNLEIFKHYPHITDIKKSRKGGGPHMI